MLALVSTMLLGDDPSRPEDVSRAVAEAETTARKALSLDSNEPNALLAMFELQGSTLDWIARDRKLRQIRELMMPRRPPLRLRGRAREGEGNSHHSRCRPPPQPSPA